MCFSARFKANIATQDAVATVRGAMVKGIDEVVNADDFFHIANHGVKAVFGIFVKVSITVFGSQQGGDVLRGGHATASEQLVQFLDLGLGRRRAGFDHGFEVAMSW